MTRPSSSSAGVLRIGVLLDMNVAADLVERTGAAMLCRLALCLHPDHHKEVPHQTSGHGQERGDGAGVHRPPVHAELSIRVQFEPGHQIDDGLDRDRRPASPTTATSTRAVDMRNGQSG